MLSERPSRTIDSLVCGTLGRGLPSVLKLACAEAAGSGQKDIDCTLVLSVEGKTVADLSQHDFGLSLIC